MCFPRLVHTVLVSEAHLQAAAATAVLCWVLFCLPTPHSDHSCGRRWFRLLPLRLPSTALSPSSFLSFHHHFLLSEAGWSELVSVCVVVTPESTTTTTHRERQFSIENKTHTPLPCSIWRPSIGSPPLSTLPFRAAVVGQPVSQSYLNSPKTERLNQGLFIKDSSTSSPATHGSSKLLLQAHLRAPLLALSASVAVQCGQK